MAYATGKHALGICDKCGQTYKLKELRSEVNFGIKSTSKVCSSCFDPDHPQWRLKTGVVDVINLRNARPDRPDRNIFWGWKPILGMQMPMYLGAIGLEGDIVTTPSAPSPAPAPVPAPAPAPAPSPDPTPPPVDQNPTTHVNVFVLATSVTATGQTGSNGFRNSSQAAISGVSAGGLIGDVQMPPTVTLSVSGVSAATALGAVTITKGGSAALTGIEATTSLGTVTMVNPEIEPGFDQAVQDLHTLLNVTMPAPNYW